MAKNVILMIGDGMGWEMARAAAIYQQIQEGKTGSTLNDFYTENKGQGLNFQNLTNYTLATTYGTTIADSQGVFSTGNTALTGSQTPTGASPLRPGFQFDPSFNPGTTATGEAKVADGAEGNLVGYDPVRGGFFPWESVYYGDSREGFDKEYIKASYPDSANTATTLYTGVKSYNNAIGVDIFEQPLETILTTANLEGKATGLVSSVPVDHATPGAASAAVNRRAKYDTQFPDLDSILQQQLRIYQPTVLLGGGHPLSNTKDPLPDGVEPPTSYEFITDDTYNYLRANPNDNRYDYNFLERGANAADVLTNTASRLDPNAGDRLLGIYGARGQNGNLPVSSANGDYSTTGLDNFSVFSSKGLTPDTKRPLAPGETDTEFIAREVNENPTLKNLADSALEVLGKDKDGFWLMIEGGDVDWSAHDNNIDNLIGTTLDFDRTVTSVIDWIEKNGGWEDNLLVVTADHDHYLTLNPNFPSLLQTFGADKLTELDTPGEVGHYWGSDSNVKYGWGNHSNRPVPVYYQGADSEILNSYIGQGYENYNFPIPGFPGHVDQSQIYQTMLSAVTGSSDRPLQSGSIFGDALNDIIYADTTDDIIFAGEGDNYLFANQGNNTVYAGAGDDLIYSGYGKDVIYAGEGNNSIFAGAGDNLVYADGGNDYLVAGSGNDTVFAGEGDNIILAGAGNNLIYTGAGNDEITTGAGNDLIYAGEGNNLINSGTGNDTVYAGNGENRFVLNAGAGSLTIFGFEEGDRIRLGTGLTSSTPLSFEIKDGDTLISTGEDALVTLKFIQVNSVPIV